MNKHNSHCSCEAPSIITTQTTAGLKGLANTYVRVVSNNTTYYVDNCHEITIISSSPVFVEDYDATTNPLNLRAQTCYDFSKNVAYAFNDTGEYRTITLEGGE